MVKPDRRNIRRDNVSLANRVVLSGEEEDVPLPLGTHAPAVLFFLSGYDNRLRGAELGDEFEEQKTWNREESIAAERIRLAPCFDAKLRIDQSSRR